MSATYRVWNKRSFWLTRTLGAAALAFGSALSLRAGDGLVTAVGVVGLVLFGFFALYGLRQLLRRGPRLTLDPRGVEASDLGPGLIPWAEITRVEAFGSSEAPFIAFYVPNPEPYLTRMPWRVRLLTRVRTASGLPTFSVNLTGAVDGVDEVLVHARRLASRSRAGALR